MLSKILRMLWFWWVCFTRSLKCFGINTFVYVDLCVDILWCYEGLTVLVHICIATKPAKCIFIIFLWLSLVYRDFVWHHFDS